MKKLALGLIFGILLIGMIGIVSAEENCSSTNLSLCLNETSCTDADGYWYNNACHTSAQVLCSAGHLNLCTNETSCETAGGEWKNNSCVTKTVKTVTVNKTRVDRENLTFTPWQKRNESECLEGCFCRGAVMTCTVDGVKTMTIQAGRSGNIIVITFTNNGEETEVETELEVETGSNGENDTELKAKMSNGEKKQIKIMPDTAAETALERLRLKNCNEENNCTIQLKEVGDKLAYELQVERHFKLLALFTAKAQVKAQVDAETGGIIVVKKPWWAFLATEPEEE